MPERPPSWRYAIPLVVALVVFALYSITQNGRWSSAQNDFVMLYLAGQLQPVGKLYDAAEYYRRHPEFLDGVAHGLIYTRPAFYSLAFVPLAKLPYMVAFGIYQILQLSVLSLWFKEAWKTSPKLLLSASVSLPLLLAFGNGQDIILVAALAGIAWLWLDRRPFVAGLLLSVCSVKAHLFLLVPIALARHGYWRTIGGGAVGGLVLVALSFVAGGAGWIQEYLKILQIKEIDGKVHQMGNIRSLAQALGIPGDLLPWMLAAGLAATAWAIWRTQTIPQSLVLALCGGLVFNWHSFLQDFTLLLTLVPFVPQLALGTWAERNWKLLLSPIPYVAAMPGAPFSALLPLSMLAFLGLRGARSKS